MAEKVQAQPSGLDTAKLGGAVALLVVGVAGFYWYHDASTLYRVLALLAIAGIAVAIAATTFKGRSTLEFLQGARTEVRKMVWPSRAETVQTTLMVLLVVVLVGIFLWLLDMFLGWGIQFIVST